MLYLAPAYDPNQLNSVQPHVQSQCQSIQSESILTLTRPVCRLEETAPIPIAASVSVLFCLKESEENQKFLNRFFFFFIQMFSPSDVLIAYIR